MMGTTVCILVSLALAASLLGPVHGIEDRRFWMDVGQKTLQEALGVRLNHGVARNVILFLGDGMSLSTVMAARVYKGQLEGRTGEETRLSFETFPHIALSKTYSVDRQTADSASTGTAYHSGVKGNFGTIGVDARVKRRNCSLANDPDVRVVTMLDWSHMAGKSVGIVTNTRVTHASPAGTYAHSPDRNWERDSDMASLPDKCVPDIATQLVRENSNITVVMGGGRRGFIGRADGQNLVNVRVVRQQTKRGKRARYVKNASELRNLNAEDTDNLMGLFTESHMTWELTRDNNSEPSLSEMTQKAIEILRKNNKGYYLFVEGGRIDHGHHDNWAKRALSETLALDEAVMTALRMTDRQDTLIVVTADHSHPFNVVGYPKRGNDILGLVDPVDPGQAPTDGKPYTTLVYGNGPGPLRSVDMTNEDTRGNEFRFPVAVQLDVEWETHSGEDVGIYATGPMAHLFHGVHEQNYIAHAMAYAACVGPNKAHCDPPSTPSPDCTGGAAGLGGGQGKWGGVMGLVMVVVTALIRWVA
ncbi:alkaline phosphatase-like [Babylonia areolata]|uniref:alkaline phosphatase-like n=1 Tax=Babylonia areolata TaxID=304850 RepID=UPI003FCF21DD